MKKTWKVFLTLVTAFVAVVLVACGQGTASKDNKEAEVKKIDFIILFPLFFFKNASFKYVSI